MMLNGFPVVPVIVGLFLVGFAAAFVRWFLLPARRLDGVLDDINARLDAERAADRIELTGCFEGDEKILSIWTHISQVRR